MLYKKEILQAEVNDLIGKSIKNVFYYTEYEGYETFHQLADEIIEIPLLGIFLETSSGSCHNIISYDYSPYYGLGGLTVFRDHSYNTPQERPAQVNTFFWKRFRKKKITAVSIIESFYERADEKSIVIPFGLKIGFEQGEECYITNMSIEGFIEDRKVYNLCRGGELVLFSGKKVFDKHSVIQQNSFKI